MMIRAAVGAFLIAPQSTVWIARAQVAGPGRRSSRSKLWISLWVTGGREVENQPSTVDKQEMSWITL